MYTTQWHLINCIFNTETIENAWLLWPVARILGGVVLFQEKVNIENSMNHAGY